MIPRRVKDLALNISEKTGLIRLLQFPLHEKGNHLIVLAYHRVDQTDSEISRRSYDLVSAAPRQFEEQMRLVAACFNPVSAGDVLNAINGGKPLPPQAVLVTVDDGYRDFKDTIFPITKKYGIHPVLFVPTAFVGDGIFWWDRLFNALTSTHLQEADTPLGHFSLADDSARQTAFDALADYVRMQPFEKVRGEIERLCGEIEPPSNKNISHVLNWDELRALAGEGVVIASHTHNHPILTHIPLEKAREEIRASQALLQREIGRSLPIFAYPDGRDHAISADLAQALKEEGIQMAFTMSDRISRLKQDDPLLFPRLIPDRSLDLARFHLRLTVLQAARNKRRDRNL
ncbi:MAG: polysaccharide deacetylase family protein [Anaerolineales bacterium]|nr:polysaccharide deacetylase family protein [Anaerolineales bacterium]